MATHTLTVVKKNLDTPDETREFYNGRMEMIDLEGTRMTRVTFRPGWRWSKDVDARTKDELSPYAVTAYGISGCLRIRLANGTEFDLKPGDCACFPVAGHEAWVTGPDPFVGIGILCKPSTD